MSSLPPLFVVSVGYLIDEVGKCLFAFVPSRPNVAGMLMPLAILKASVAEKVKSKSVPV